MSTIPQFNSYGQYSSSNYGAHTMRFELPNGVMFYYSYDTLIAFYSPTTGLKVHTNDWSTTTGKHLNWINDEKKSRLDSESFAEALQGMLEHHGLAERNCNECGEPLFGTIRVHHHTEDGKDVTT